MAFDGIVIRAITNELIDTIHGGKVEKIYQPLAKELIIKVRARGKSHQLFISCDPTHPRIHLTNTKYTNPEIPPMYCMLLRKYLEGSYVRRIEQWKLERMIKIEFEALNELGDTARFWLVVEIMGKHSNILFIDPSRKIILDSIHHVNRQVNSFRELLPGKEYTLPPTQDKLNVMEMNTESLETLLTAWKSKESSGEAVLWKQFFLHHFQGISPMISELLWEKSHQQPDQLINVANDLQLQLKQHDYQPCLVEQNNGKYIAFSAVDLQPLYKDAKVNSFASINACIDAFYQNKAQHFLVQRESHSIFQKVNSSLKRSKNKLEKLVRTLEGAEQAEQYRLMGELLTANLYQMQKGLQQVIVIDYYDPEQSELIIPLDPRLTPNENAQSYFKKYNKQKNSIPVVTEQIQVTRLEIDYLESILQQLETTELDDLAEIRQELEEEGYWFDNKTTQHKKKQKQQKIIPQKYVSSSGIDIWVGKNNKQNDVLTTQLADKLDTWLHTKDIPGSHVVIRSTQYDDTTLLEAAHLAAYFSKARESGQVPVDYTLVKHVKKPSGSKPGYVIYEQQKTLYINPDLHTIKTLVQK
ncbi:hypothetical protein BHU72_02880 [Desulfuribacillus stibiiarsenatis]|uniref:Rqc2 homolog RqcH n=1 Tax=Desulfuribacillus stibiiarsenatis TaxID=1390249 RepID=A0A1E5L6F3_9FIRM|nr:NFACT RNA binding domain-containing protein [Desulfuribacillus stibiiarsenatis]OEH85742.1 hypothetical protein BHU72_02880 [Desulfuribacillus stibiiarsenatis]